jgi:hypothetical protein
MATITVLNIGRTGHPMGKGIEVFFLETTKIICKFVRIIIR